MIRPIHSMGILPSSSGFRARARQFSLPSLLVLLGSSLLHQVVSVRSRVGVRVVLDGHLVELQQRVLDQGVLLAAVLAAKVVQPLDLVEHVVDDRDEDADTNRVRPYNDHCHNVRPAVVRVHEQVLRVRLHHAATAARQPAKETKDCCQDIDHENGAYELPRGPRLATSGDENQPVLRQGNLQEEDLLNGAKVLNDTTVGQEHGTTDDPGSDSKQKAQNNTDDPDLAKLPFHGSRLDVRIIVGDRYGGQVGEEGDENDEIRADSFVQDDHRGGEVDFQMQTERNTILNVCLHTLEDLSGRLDGQDDRAETRGKEHNISGSLRSFG